MTSFDPDFNSPREIADFYRRKGLQPIPAKGKRPAVEWKAYQNAPISQEVFEGWYNEKTGTQRSNGDIGTLLGKASGNKLMADLDIYKPGGEAANNWYLGVLAVHNNGLELETWEQVTGGGGRQLFFECPVGWTPPNVTTDIFVDIKGQGGFAVLPPSRHSSGKLYKWREGRSPDDIPIMVAPQWLCEEIERLAREHGGARASGPRTGGNGKYNSASGTYDDWGHRKDGREDYLTRFVWGAACDYRRAEGAFKPTPNEVEAKAKEKYTVYFGIVTSKVDGPPEDKERRLEAEGRGWTEFWAKWRRAIDQWDGKLRDEADKPPPKQEAPDLEADFGAAAEKAKATGDTFERLDIPQIKNLSDPKWLVGGLIIEQALGFVYGPPGCLKTFIALDLALTFATAKPLWWGRAVERGGAVIYISSEGLGDLKFRIKAWEQHRKTVADASPFRLIRQGINFMKAEDVGKLLATVQAVADETKAPIAAVFVDTVSRVLPGSDENLQKDMTVFVAACDAVRQRFGATVVGIHHTSRAGNMRGSTVIPAAGDFIVEVRREPGAAVGSIFAAKIKAGEDGWEQQFKTVTVQLGDIGGHSSLVIDADPGGGAASADAPGSGPAGWPTKDTLRQILAAIAEQWLKKEPWCYSKNSPRSATVNIMKRWRIKRKIVDDILAEWVAHGVVAHDTLDAKRHIQGYRKMMDI